VDGGGEAPVVGGRVGALVEGGAFDVADVVGGADVGGVEAGAEADADAEAGVEGEAGGDVGILTGGTHANGPPTARLFPSSCSTTWLATSTTAEDAPAGHGRC
jgi:hypothetical protein